MKCNTFAMINGHEVEFYINEAKKTVCAVIKGCELDPYDYVRERIRNTKLGYAMLPYTTPMSYSYRAVACCYDPDIYDENVGKRIAYKKLSMKYWYHMGKRLNKCTDMLQRELDYALGLAKSVWDIRWKEQNEYYDMCKEVDIHNQEVSPDYGG